jgi:integrase/recombinase XerD
LPEGTNQNFTITKPKGSMKNLPLHTYAYRILEQECKEWLALLGYASSTVYNIPLYLHEFFHWLETQHVNQVETISTHHAQAFIEYIKTRPHAIDGRILSSAHVNKYHQALRLLSKFIRQTDRGTFTVEDQRLPQQRQLPEVLTQAEVKELYNACDNSVLGLRDKAMLGIYYGCGLRRNEGVHVDISDIDFTGQLVYVREGKNYSERYVPASAMILQHIKDYLEHSRPFLLTRHKTAALLLSDKGNRAQGQSLFIRIKKLASQAKITKPIGLHTLRHSIATHLLRSGMELEHIAKFLGHQSLEATQIYTHISHENL